MRELVRAVFDTASAANTAVQDLEVARIPSAIIQRELKDDAKLRDSARTRLLVNVVVDEMHAAVVTGVLNQYGPLEIEQRAAKQPPA